MRSRSEVDAKKVPKVMGTSAAVSCHDPPALPPAEGMLTPTVALSVRLEKFTSSCAAVSVPAVLSWFVGEVWTTSP